MTSVRPTDGSERRVQVERRLGPRHQVFLAGKAQLVGGRVIDVTFRDLSARGARLLVPAPAALFGEVAVVILKEALVLRSRVIWGHPPMFGVEFREAIDLRGEYPSRYDPLAEAWRCWDDPKQ
ncbi:MAG: PilZ domain-containing protein [Caulobacteraceae bacterium]|nr:PilZ domain-containing protein [Caulobacteraceae bacterium]